jgi:hypothetical protein
MKEGELLEIPEFDDIYASSEVIVSYAITLS